MTQENIPKNSIRINLLRESQLSNMHTTEKVRYIIDCVRDGCVVVLESGLKPNEQSLLVEKTMSEIDHDSFTGVEIESYPESQEDTADKGGLLGRVLSRESSTSKAASESLTVIGPANQMETLHKDEKQISAILNP